MKNIALVVCWGVSLVVLARPSGAQETFWGDAAQGWFWYGTAPLFIEPVLEPAAQLPAQEIVAPELAAHKALQQRLEQRRVIAIMSPTQANLSRYLYTQREVMQRASIFADVWQRVVWADPELDYGVRNRPTNAVALRTWDAEQRNKQTSLLADAARNHGLFFIFGPDCLHCEQMAGLLARFVTRHGMEVQAVAVGGAKHPAFPNAWPDNGFVTASGVQRLPVLLLVRLDDDNQEIIPLAYGPLADLELEQRIAVLTGIGIGERF